MAPAANCARTLTAPAERFHPAQHDACEAELDESGTRELCRCAVAIGDRD
jgi:hypothetical protein